VIIKALLSFPKSKKFTMKTQPTKKDFFSNFVNWFSSLGVDKPSIEKPNGGQDFFSRIMNRISS
tara:strand:+ start:191 stop:382 length:192 start_codon:yes stop_codon:yes gene_type:complete